MTHTEFLALVTSIRDEQDKLLAEKGADYTQQSDDVLHNFKAVAEWTGLTPIQIWSVYFAKHILAIMSYVRYGDVKSESIEGRFRDAGNYLLLGEGLITPAEKPIGTYDCTYCNKKGVGYNVHYDARGRCKRRASKDYDSPDDAT